MQKHKHDCDEVGDLKFPIIYSYTYKQSILGCQRKKHGIDDDLAFYIYRTLEEEEILDSKYEEELWYEDAARKIVEDDEKSSDADSPVEDENVMNVPNGDNKKRKEAEMKRRKDREKEKEIERQLSNFDRQKYSPEEEKNFYHDPDSPSRAFLMDKLSLGYLLKMCYSWPLSKYLGVPGYFLPGWVIRFGVLIPQAQVAKGTVDGIGLAIRHGWAINLDGGYTHAHSSSGSMFNVYPDITLAIHYAKKWHIQSSRRILVINTSCGQANGVITDYPEDEGVYVLDIFDPNGEPKDTKSQFKVHEKVTIGSFDNDESYITKIRHKVNLALSSYAPDLVIYNAGYDMMRGDYYGNMQVSESIIILRDELIFREVIEDQGVPILMTVGGGYQNNVDSIIARSIRNIIVQLQLSRKPLLVSTAQNVKFARKLQNKYNRYDNQELGFTQDLGRSTTRRGSSHHSVRFDPEQRKEGARFENERNTEMMHETEEKYSDTYNRLKKGLYDPESIGVVDIFSNVR